MDSSFQVYLLEDSKFRNLFSNLDIASYMISYKLPNSTNIKYFYQFEYTKSEGMTSLSNLQYRFEHVKEFLNDGKTINFHMFHIHYKRAVISFFPSDVDSRNFYLPDQYIIYDVNTKEMILHVNEDGIKTSIVKGKKIPNYYFY